MLLNETIKTDALSVLAEAKRAVEEHDVSLLKRLSDHTLHNTTIYQDMVSINTAILMYALYKAFLHNHTTPARIIPLLTRIEHAILSEDEERIRKAYRAAFHSLKRDMRDSILEVMHHASLQKVRKVYEHGVSLAHAARLMNLSLWDVVEYVGLTRVHEMETGRDILTRVKHARKAFQHGFTFDAGPIIAFTLTGILEDLARTAQQHDTLLLVPRDVERELIDHPLQTKKYAFEAYRVLTMFSRGVLRMTSSHRIRRQAISLMHLANSMFKAKGEWIRIVSLPEMSVIMHAAEEEKTAVIDERAMRMLVEQPRSLAEWMARKLHTKVHVDEKKLLVWRNAVKRVRIVRSVDIAFAMALDHAFDHYLPDAKRLEHVLPHAHAYTRENLVRAILWSLKLHGCSVSSGEIDRAVNAFAKWTRTG